MSPQAGTVLLEQIAPRLKAAVPYIKPVGSEDSQELFQDGLCMAAHLLENNELNGKKVGRKLGGLLHDPSPEIRQEKSLCGTYRRDG